MAEQRQYHCKKCEAAFESRVDLMNHYRLEHPKKKDGGPMQAEAEKADDNAEETEGQVLKGAPVTSDADFNDTGDAVKRVAFKAEAGRLLIPVDFCPAEVKLLSKGNIVGLRVAGTLKDGYVAVDQIDLIR